MASPDKKSFALRLDPALWAEVERLAAQELRSANAQIEYLLREALARRGIKPTVNRSPRGRPPKDGSSAEPGSESAESSEG